MADDTRVGSLNTKALRRSLTPDTRVGSFNTKTLRQHPNPDTRFGSLNAKTLRRRYTVNDPYRLQVLADSPWAYWPLNDSSAPSLTAGDTGSEATPFTYADAAPSQPSVITGKSVRRVGDVVAEIARRPSVPSALAGANVSAAVELFVPAGNWQGAVLGIGASNGWGFGIGGTTLDNAGRQLILLDEGVAWRPTGYSFPAGDGRYMIHVVRGAANAFTVYVNGVSVYTGTHAPAAATTNIVVGAQRTSSVIRPLPKELRVGPVALFASALSTARVTAHWNGGDGSRAAIMADSPAIFLEWTESPGVAHYDDVTGLDRSLYVSGTNPAVGTPGPMDRFALFDTAARVLLSRCTVAQPTVFTYETWVNLPSNPSEKVILLTGGSQYGGSIWGMTSYLFVDIDGKPGLGIYNGSGVEIKSPDALVLDTWHHLVASCGPAGMKLRVNKVTKATNAATSATSAAAAQPAVHSGSSSGFVSSSSVTIKIAEAAYYRAQLSDARTDAHFDSRNPLAVSGRITGSSVIRGARLSYVEEVLLDSPLAYYRLGESSGTTMVDSSGNGRNGTYVGSPASVEGLLVSDTDASRRFPGTTTRGSVPYNAAWMVPSALTAEAWFRPGRLTGRNMIFGHAHNASGANSTDYSWQLLWNGSQIEVVVFTTASRPTQLASVGLVADSVYHVATTWDGSTGRIYLNGVEVHSWSQGGTLWSGSGSNMTIGTDSFGTYLKALGDIDEVAFYDYALSPSRILAHYEAGVYDPTADITVPTGKVVSGPNTIKSFLPAATPAPEIQVVGVDPVGGGTHLPSEDGPTPIVVATGRASGSGVVRALQSRTVTSRVLGGSNLVFGVSVRIASNRVVGVGEVRRVFYKTSTGKIVGSGEVLGYYSIRMPVGRVIGHGEVRVSPSFVVVAGRVVGSSLVLNSFANIVAAKVVGAGVVSAVSAQNVVDNEQLSASVPLLNWPNGSMQLSLEPGQARWFRMLVTNETGLLRFAPNDPSYIISAYTAPDPSSPTAEELVLIEDWPDQPFDVTDLDVGDIVYVKVVR